MTNPEVYPLTAELEVFLNDRLQQNNLRGLDYMAAEKLVHTLTHTFGEYEHGTAEAINCMPDEFIERFKDDTELGTLVALKTLKAVYEDIFLCHILDMSGVD
jgi:hypothetical protein